jgi:hypothetical protein
MRFRSVESQHANIKGRGRPAQKIVPAESLIEQSADHNEPIINRGVAGNEGKSMRSKSDHAWRMAANCAKLAQEADQKDEREFYVRMRDSWITVANRYAFLDIVDEHGAPAPLSPPRAGRYMPNPVSRSLERRRSPLPRR